VKGVAGVFPHVDKGINTMKPGKTILLAVLFLFSALIGGAVEKKQRDGRSLYLKDGSVFKGDILSDSRGDFIVYNRYGEFTVKAEEVLYVMGEKKSEFRVRETYLVEGEGADVINILQKNIPEREEGVERFYVLVPGNVEGIYSRHNVPLDYQSTEIGELTRLSIGFDDIPEADRYFFITTRRKGFLKKDESGKLLFQTMFTPDEDLSYTLIVKYPKEWKPLSIVPEPTRKWEGLVVWEKDLKRQKSLKPGILFSPKSH